MDVVAVLVNVRRNVVGWTLTVRVVDLPVPQDPETRSLLLSDELIHPPLRRGVQRLVADPRNVDIDSELGVS